MDLRDRTKLIQGLNDRLLYLDDKQQQEFLSYLETLYSVFPCPRKVLYGEEINQHESNKREQVSHSH